MTKMEPSLKHGLDEVSSPAPDLDAILERGRRLRWQHRAATSLRVLAALIILAIGVASVTPWAKDALQRFSPAGTSDRQGAVHLRVYLNGEATSEQVQAIQDAARSIEGVVDIDFRSEEETFEEFKERYRDRPEDWANLSPGALPARLFVTLSHERYLEAAEERLRAEPGVDATASTRDE